MWWVWWAFEPVGGVCRLFPGPLCGSPLRAERHTTACTCAWRRPACGGVTDHAVCVWPNEWRVGAARVGWTQGGQRQGQWSPSPQSVRRSDCVCEPQQCRCCIAVTALPAAQLSANTMDERDATTLGMAAHSLNRHSLQLFAVTATSLSASHRLPPPHILCSHSTPLGNTSLT